MSELVGGWVGEWLGDPIVLMEVQYEHGDTLSCIHKHWNGVQ